MGIAHLQADLRRWGWTRNLLIRLVPWLLKQIGLHLYRVGLRPLGSQPANLDLPRGITLRVVQPDELLRACDDPELDVHPDFARAALARGDMVFGAFDGARLVACAWRCFSAAPLLDGIWSGRRIPFRTPAVRTGRRPSEGSACDCSKAART